MSSAARKSFLPSTAIAVTAALLLSGCGALGLGKEGDVTLKLVAPDYGTNRATSTEPYWQELAKSFEAANPGIKVEVEVVSWTDIDTRVAELIKNNKSPDLVQTGGYADHVAAGRLYPAGDVLTIETQANMLASIAQAGQVLGSQYGIPFTTSSRLFVYNKAIFEKAGITTPPATWDEMAKAAKKIKEKVPGVTPYALPLGPEEAQAEGLIWATGGGGGFADDTGTYSINSDANQKTFDWLRTSLVTPGLTYKDPGTVSRAAAFEEFAAGKVAMLNGHPQLALNADKAGIPYGTAPLLRKDAQGKPPSMGVADWMMAFKANGHRAEIKKFLTHVYQKENVIKFASMYNLLPVTQDAREEMAGSGHNIKPFLDALTTARFYPYGETSWDRVSGLLKKQLGGAVKNDGQGALSALQGAAVEAAEQSRRTSGG
ncbi:extracellular solute-binding protein [Kitasatospora sp. NPDC096147]|uniref:extracellular solute-binding protein n=1 Tax=Kitasatospora sp. NPDC096147 TaxID=3364093 RepID=UPI003828897F